MDAAETRRSSTDQNFRQRHCKSFFVHIPESRSYPKSKFEYYTDAKILWSEANLRTRTYDGPSGDPIERDAEPEHLLNYKAQGSGQARISRYPKMPEDPMAEGAESAEVVERKSRLFEGLANDDVVESDAQAESPLRET